MDLIAAGIFIANMKAVIGQGLPIEQQLFISQYHGTLVQYLTTDVGKLAMQTFVADWEAGVKKPPVTAASKG